jgi:hypothetical protein
MLGIPTADEIKSMADAELQTFLDSLKARETDFFTYLDSRKVVVTFEPKEPAK